MSVLFPAVLATASPDCLDRLYPATVILSQIVINPLSVMISATLSAAGECVKGPAPGQPRCKSGGVACLESYQHCVEDHLSRQATAATIAATSLISAVTWRATAATTRLGAAPVPPRVSTLSTGGVIIAGLRQISIRDIARRTGLPRNTIRKYLRSGSVEPKFKVPERPSKLDPFADRLSAWLKT
jgi:hypothetical protein